MIQETDNLFTLSTRNTTYIFHLDETNHLEHLYYGRRFEPGATDIDAIVPKRNLRLTDYPAISADYPDYQCEDVRYELATEGKGDYRAPSIVIGYNGGFNTLDFVYQKHTLRKGTRKIPLTIAQAKGSENECETLTVTLKEKLLPITVQLHYTVFEACDVIVRSATLYNGWDIPVTVRNLASFNLDLADSNWQTITFNGTWARERIPERRDVSGGRFINESRSGLSSSEHNPLLYLVRPDTSETAGEVIATNLIWSGSHRESVEQSPFGKLRIQSGINPDSFSWKLNPQSSFHTPEGVITYSDRGISGACGQFASFVNDHIVSGTWNYRQRPVVLNTWEANYFDVDEKKLLAQAKMAAKLGFELFMLDDGWFGTRDDDTSGLGEWYPNSLKLPNGIGSLSEKIHKMGMMFGLWIEPEMVNIKSRLYLDHPDWAIMIPDRKPAVGRNQFILDFTRREVRDHLFKMLCELFESSDINYVKWDMNRLFSDLYSINREIRRMGEFSYRYVLGLYDLASRLNKRFPEILFEGCASGGGRYDLGMLCYFPQIWTSDNTDAYYRTKIQEGTSYGYPPSTMCCHVSASPNHQCLRTTPLASRFNVAVFGVLGYQLDILKLSKEEQGEVADQIQFYKQFRSVFQYGSFHRVLNGNILQWDMVSADRSTIMALRFQTHNPVNASDEILRIPEADPAALYTVEARCQSRNTESERYTVSGGALRYAGISLLRQFSGTGRSAKYREMGDFSSRLYIVKKV